VEFENGVLGIVFNLEVDNVGVIIMGDTVGIAEASSSAAPGALFRCRWATT